MCGIAGVYDISASVDERLMSKMASALEHRGPDGQHFWLAPSKNVGFAHARLAIIDLQTGDQPIHSADGRYSIILNGEIYNYGALKAELQALGHVFATSSDTEVLLAAFIQWGEACLTRLNGMFAFAIWDAVENRLFLARDRTGIKPLYYYARNGYVVFASEMKAILLDPKIPRKCSYRALADFLVFSYTVPPSTFFEEIFELAPGSYMNCRDGNIEIQRYWKWQRNESPRDREVALAEMTEALIASVDDHFVSDVPVGAFLSGGVDSSLICAIATRELGRSLDTFTVGFNQSTHDESEVAEVTARHLGTRHHKLLIDDSLVTIDLVDHVMGQFDQPFGDSSALPTYLLSQEISKHMKVVLSGDGGDEMFGGYPRFFHADLTKWLHRHFGRSLAAGYPLSRLMLSANAQWGRTAQRVLNAATQRGGGRLTWFSCYTAPESLSGIITEHVHQKLAEYVPSLETADMTAQPGADEFFDVTIERVLPGDYLRKVDVSSGAHGLEVRVPFLGNQVLDFSASLEKAHKFRGAHTKVLSRALLNRYLPAHISKLPKKGFAIPLRRILTDIDKQHLRRRLMESEELSHFVKREYIDEISQLFVSNRRRTRQLSEFMIYQKFYGLLALEVWLRKWMPSG